MSLSLKNGSKIGIITMIALILLLFISAGKAVAEITQIISITKYSVTFKYRNPLSISSYKYVTNAPTENPRSNYLAAFMAEPYGINEVFVPLAPGTRHILYIYREGEQATPLEYTSSIIITPPESPTMLTPDYYSTSQIRLRWSDNNSVSDTKYNIYKDNIKIASEVTGKTYTVSGLSPGTTYTFKVEAVCNGIAESSNTINATTVPPAPTNLSVSQEIVSWHQTEGRIKNILTWSPSNGATGYLVEVHDGYTWRRFSVGNTTTWDSSVWKIYPSESVINGYQTNTRTANIFNTVKGGLDLRDDPRNLYRSALSDTYNETKHYMYRVYAYSDSSSYPSPASAVVNSTYINATDNIRPQITSIATDTGLSKTTSANVKLSVTASDTESGLRRILVSNNSDMSGAVTINWPEQGASQGSVTFDFNLPGGSGSRTVYVKAEDMAGNVTETASTINLYLIDDVTPPQINLVINEGDAISTSPLLKLLIESYDDYSSIADLRMRFSFDGRVWTEWEDFAFVKDINLSLAEPLPGLPSSSGFGIKRILVQVIDRSGNIGNGYASINYVDETEEKRVEVDSSSKTDKTPPVVEARWADNRSLTTNNSSVPIAIKAVDDVTPSNMLEMSLDNGATWKPFSRFTNITVTGTGVKTYFVLVRDSAGNVGEDMLSIYVM